MNTNRPVITPAKDLRDAVNAKQQAKKLREQKRLMAFAVRVIARAKRIAKRKGWSSYTFRIPSGISSYNLEVLFTDKDHEYIVENHLNSSPKKMTIRW
jgi:hypothetical protein